MAKIEQSAGEFRLETWTDGHPYWIKVFRDGEELACSLTVSDLHDLRYCIGRMLAALGDKQ